MGPLPNTLVEIARAGGGLDIDASRLMQNFAEEIARAAASSNMRPTIIFRNVKWLPDAVMTIARAGKGCVVFVY